MVLPQFSIRWLLAATAMCAVVLSIIALAVRGHGWAVGVSFALGSLAAAMVVYALLSAVVGLVCLLLPAGSGRRGASPFAATAADGAPATGAADHAVLLEPPAGAGDSADTPRLQAEVVRPD